VLYRTNDERVVIIGTTEDRLTNHSYWFCESADVPGLIEEAKSEAERLLQELSAFYAGDIDIEIGAVQHGNYWSITGTLVINGEARRTEDPCDLLFLDLNELLLKRLSRQNGEQQLKKAKNKERTER